MSVLQLRGVARSFAGHRVLTAVDLTVGEGEIVVLLGRSGSGKTTLLTIATGFDAPDEGTVERAGTGWRDLAVLPQSLGLLPELTVAENVALPLRLERVDESRVDELLGRLGLRHLADRLPAETSLGEQQRTALARAAVVHPTLLVADEPVSHQNRAWAEAMMALLRELADAGTACLLATHDGVAVDAADRVVQLHDGRLSPSPW